ncbi:MAG: hypothetical protein EOO10_03530 [Chitinophagaceae bacterium]|nr:MAG: hypothetical protein EOO10_03530 [Chitinophagaceae bacterium]
MSFKQNHMINLGNYEEYFVLYMDNELNAEQKAMVESFVAQHPELGPELDMLMSTKLPLDEISFRGKEDLFSSAMKINAVDESLLLYIDDELPAAEKKIVQEKISSNEEFALQHSLLMQAKLDGSEKIAHPNKKELYRHTERVVAFKDWMRIAAAVILLLVGSLFFLLNKNEDPSQGLATTTSPAQQQIPATKQEPSTEPILPMVNPAIEETILAQASTEKQPKAVVVKKNKTEVKNAVDVVSPNQNIIAVKEREVIKFDVKSFTAIEPITKEDIAGVNKNITRESVTSPITASYNPVETPMETAVTDGDFKNTKRTSAKGFFRKVTRFIERNTGIGTANADDEVLIGAVALKLK